MRRTLTILPVLLVAATACFFLVAVGPAPGDATPQAPPEESWEPVDAEVCATCHQDVVDGLGDAPHSLLADAEWNKSGGANDLCSGCHGDPTAHLEDPTAEGSIFSFGEDQPVFARIQACQGCHGDTHPGFLASAHAAAALDCGSCHQIHGETSTRALLRVPESVDADDLRQVGASSLTCLECHAGTFAQFELNEAHNLQQGIVGCTDCHNPHEAQARARLGGFKQASCTECHVAQAGPFIFEHAAQKVEGCTACHSPHGSVNRHMLKFQRVAELCYSCHAGIPGFHARFTLDTNCSDCHSSIHGSNFDPAYLK